MGFERLRALGPPVGIQLIDGFDDEDEGGNDDDDDDERGKRKTRKKNAKNTRSAWRGSVKKKACKL